MNITTFVFYGYFFTLQEVGSKTTERSQYYYSHQYCF
jgi:hypothetical protein